MQSKNWIRAGAVSAAVWSGGGAMAATPLFLENFDAAPLQDSVDEHEGNVANSAVVYNAWSPTLAGWNLDRTQMPGYGNPNQDGVTEWAGWAVASNKFWSVDTDNQRRQEFTKSKGNVLVADSDEWDDNAHAAGQYRSFATTPSINLAGTAGKPLRIAFDSSWRPEGNQTAHLAVSFDAGATYDDVLTWTSVPGDPNYHADATNESVALDIPTPAGASALTLRFGLTDAGNNWWWAMDNVDVTGDAVPEPAAVSTLGLAGLAMLRRRRR